MLSKTEPKLKKWYWIHKEDADYISVNVLKVFPESLQFKSGKKNLRYRKNSALYLFLETEEAALNWCIDTERKRQNASFSSFREGKLKILRKELTDLLNREIKE